jgi:hypothetical protein
VINTHPGFLPESPHGNKQYSYHPGNYQGLGSSVLGIKIREQKLGKRILLALELLRKLKGFRNPTRKHQK